ncbi:MAG: hypothetical protein ACFFKA_15200 [Candidatus Thorarchaeota archaeon]
MNQLLRVNLEGIPLDLANKLLGVKVLKGFSPLIHIFLHSKFQHYLKNKRISYNRNNVSLHSHLGLIDSLYSTISKLKYNAPTTAWSNYYQINNYSMDSFENKKNIVSEFLSKINSSFTLDLGSNTGLFSRLASLNSYTISADNDHVAVEINYLKTKKEKNSKMLPLLIDIMNPSSSSGWANREFLSFFDRCNVGTLIALGLIHHLAISNNVQLHMIASLFCRLCKNLIIEFIPKSDSQVVKLLRNRKDIYSEYNQERFESEFEKKFRIIKKEKIIGSERTLYLFETCIGKK